MENVVVLGTAAVRELVVFGASLLDDEETSEMCRAEDPHEYRDRSIALDNLGLIEEHDPDTLNERGIWAGQMLYALMKSGAALWVPAPDDGGPGLEVDVS